MENILHDFEVKVISLMTEFCFKQKYPYQSHLLIRILLICYLIQVLHKAVLVSQEGFEPPTPGLEGPCSIQLSY